MKIPALVGKKDFDNVFKNSDTSFSSGPFVVILKKNEISSARTGIIIQKKFVKLAVNRNYIKRKLDYYLQKKNRKKNKCVRQLIDQ